MSFSIEGAIALSSMAGIASASFGFATFAEGASDKGPFSHEGLLVIGFLILIVLLAGLLGGILL